MNKKNKIIVVFTALSILTACSANEERSIDNSFIGMPIDISINIPENTGMTRSGVQMPVGKSAYLTLDHATMKEYYYNEAGKLLAPSPLKWTSTGVETVFGYFVNNGNAIPAASGLYTISTTNNNNCSYLAGMDKVKFSDDTNTYPNKATLTLRQQLAKIIITVKSADGTSVASEGKLGGGMLYTTGTFSHSFDDNGYAKDGDNNTGWTIATNRDPVTMELAAPIYNSSESTYTFEAIILPQTISDTEKPFFSVKVSTPSSNAEFTAQYRLNSVTTFRAGCLYYLIVDDVTMTLYMYDPIYVQDFEDFDASRIAVTPKGTMTWS